MISVAPRKMKPVRAIEREHDAEQQHLLLVLARHPEAAHDDEEDEQVVDRERLLGDVAGEVLPAHGAAAEDQHAEAEQDRDADVERRPDRGLLQRGHVGLADVEDEVEDQHRQDAAMLSAQTQVGTSMACLLGRRCQFGAQPSERR